MSKGVHELDEDTCLRYFNPLLAAIMEVLEEKLGEKRREDQKEQTTKEIDAINRDLAEAESED